MPSAHERPPRDLSSACGNTLYRKRGASGIDSSKKSNRKQEKIEPSDIQHDTSKEGRHFLRGINLNQCQDILSIPSPPTPGSSERRRHRRLSMSFLTNKVSTPFQDTTNRNTGISPLANGSYAILDPKAERSKKRRSLCHVPSPLENGGNKSKRPPPATSVVFEESDDEIEHSDRRKKRSKRRQSLLLPSEHTESFGMQPFSLESDNITIRADNTGAKVKSLSRSDFADLQKLVRGYCSDVASSHATQHRLQCADTIKERTGYVLCCRHLASDKEELSESTVDNNNSNRMKLLKEKEPVLMQMERERKAETEEEKLLMRCSFEKSARGKYRYTDLNGKKITRDEYRIRYAQMTTRKKEDKMHAFKVLRARIDPVPTAMISQRRPFGNDGDDDEEEPKPPETLPKPHRDDDDDKDCDDSQSRCEPRSTQKGTKKATEAPSLPLHETDLSPKHQTGNILTDSSPKMQTGSIVTEKGQILQEPNHTNFGSDRVEVAPQAKGVASRKKTDDSKDHVIRASEPGGEQDCLLPLPSRGQETGDPEIAEAESRLWKAIDTALETYSMQVMAIQARRKAETTTHNPSQNGTS